MTASTKREIADRVAELIQRYGSVPEQHRGRVMNELIRVMLPHFKAWAPSFCRRSGDVRFQHRDDVESIIAERFIEVVKESLEGKHAKVTNWYSYLYGVAQYAVLAYFNSNAATIASGMTNAIRNRRRVAHMQEQLRSTLGRDPSPQEVVDAYNADMRAKRSNPEKQGVLITVADLDVNPVGLDIDDHDRPTGEDDAIIAPVEGRTLVGQIIAACEAESDLLGDVAQVWLGRAYAEPPVMGDVKDVAKTLSITKAKATSQMEKARTVAKDLCQRKYGLALAF